MSRWDKHPLEHHCETAFGSNVRNALQQADGKRERDAVIVGSITGLSESLIDKFKANPHHLAKIFNSLEKMVDRAGEEMNVKIDLPFKLGKDDDMTALKRLKTMTLENTRLKAELASMKGDNNEDWE